MSTRKTILLVVFVSVFIISSYGVNALRSASDGLPHPGKIDGQMLASVPAVDVAIESFQHRIQQNPNDAVSYALLGEQYSRLARETGDISQYQRAERALNEALALSPHYTPAKISLASIYFSQHDFRQALDISQQVYETNYKNSQARVITADSYLALGQYREAKMIYEELSESYVTPALLARLANLAELHGDSDLALRRIRQAAADALHSGGTQENAAWYLLRVGDIYFHRGEIKRAGEFYEAALRVFDNYYLAYAGLGKVYAAQENYEDAIVYYQKAVDIVPQPEFLAALGDLYTITGQRDKAKIQYETVEYIGQLASSPQQVYNRQLANFYSDHDLNVKEALRLALQELEYRKDIYGYDAAAWALYRNGEYQQAQTMMDQALALGTRDARLFYHAGMIAHALHHDQQAAQYLEQALTINAHFSILDADNAWQTLQSLRQTASR